MNGLNLKNLLDQIKTQRIKVYSILTFPLDAARSDFELTISGTYFYVINQTGAATIKFNEIIADSIDILKSRQIIVPFYRLYISNIAQAGLSMTLAIGVSSDIFSIQDYSAPDIAAMSGYTQQLRDSFAYNYGDQIIKSSLAAGVSTILVHLVNAGKTFLLEHYGFKGWSGPGGGGQISLYVTNGADVLQYYISNFYLSSASIVCIETGTVVFSIPTGWKVKIISEVNVSCSTFIKGREI